MANGNAERLSEEYVQDAFHSYLKSSLTQAKVEKLLDVEVLSSAESDLMITGPALCLYFAALRCTTNPPSVPLPRLNKSTTALPLELSGDNCPPAFISFLRVWAACVSDIQSLSPEHQHDLARIICNLPPLSQPLNPNLNRISADMRAVAIEISQRRTFQERYSSDLQAAIDAGQDVAHRGRQVKASFVPPPVYNPSPSPTSSAHSTPSRPTTSLPSSASPTHTSFSHDNSPYLDPKAPLPRPPSPQILTPHSPAIEFIRETLYASLADVLERQPSLRRLLRHDAPRAYFASVSFAVLSVAQNYVTPEGTVQGVMGRTLTLDDCPPNLRPFMAELGAIGRAANEMEAADDDEAVRLATEGVEDIPVPRMERVKKMLEEGVCADEGWRERADGSARGSNGRRSVEGRAVAFVNRINALALGMTSLRAFKERQHEVFKVLSGVGT